MGVIVEKHIGLVTEPTHTIWVADVTCIYQLHFHAPLSSLVGWVGRQVFALRLNS